MSPALAGGFLSTAPPGKSLSFVLPKVVLEICWWSQKYRLYKSSTKKRGGTWEKKDKKVKSQFRRSNIQIIRIPKRENGEKNINEIIQENALELKDICFQNRRHDG